MSLKKIISMPCERGDLDPYITITVPYGETTLTEVHVQKFFLENPSVTHVRIPKGVTQIGTSVFAGCSSLISLEGLENVTQIGASVFLGCSSLIRLEGLESVTQIGDHAFDGCSSLKSLEGLGDVTQIGNNAFRGCTGLKYVVLPEGLTRIDYSAFSECSGLAILAPADLMGDPQLTSIPDVHLYNRSNPEHVLTFNQLPEVQTYNPYFSMSLFQSSRCLFGPRQRTYINTVLLVAARLDSIFFNRVESGEGDADADDTNSSQELSLPPELWIYILGFVRRRDMTSVQRSSKR